jgi:protoheme IX farnesyltransferase
VPEPALVSRGARLRAFYELGKPNLSFLVATTGVIGFYLASPAVSWARLAHLVAGLFATSAGAAGLNMVLERDLDSRMRRTRVRPIPSGRVSPKEALVFALIVFGAGFVELWGFANPLTALLALFTALVYAFIYTPLKPRGALAVWVGAIPGAIPPLMGWTAARGAVEAPALVLFGTLFAWQFPHFLALAWMYREDYLRAGFDFLGQDRTGRRTGRAMVIGCVALLPVSLMLTVLDVSGWLVALGGGGCGIGFLWQAIRAMRRPSQLAARRVFFASIIYLPVFLVLIVIEKALLR